MIDDDHHSSSLNNNNTSSQLRESLLGAGNNESNNDELLDSDNNNIDQHQGSNQQQGGRETRIRQLRWMTIGATMTTFLLELISLPHRLIIQIWISPAKAVLTAYLALFCLLIFGSELVPDNYQLTLRDNLGILYHPLGRGILLLLMAGMSFGILGSIWEMIFIFPALSICSIGHVYFYCKFRNYFQQDEDFAGSDHAQQNTWQEQSGGRLIDPNDVEERISTARSNALSWAIRYQISNVMSRNNTNDDRNGNNRQPQVDGQQQQQQEEESQLFLNQDIVS